MRAPIEGIQSQWLEHAVIGYFRNLPDFDETVRNISVFLNTSRLGEAGRNRIRRPPR